MHKDISGKQKSSARKWDTTSSIGDLPPLLSFFQASRVDLTFHFLSKLFPNPPSLARPRSPRIFTEESFTDESRSTFETNAATRRGQRPGTARPSFLNSAVATLQQLRAAFLLARTLPPPLPSLGRQRRLRASTSSSSSSSSSLTGAFYAAPQCAAFPPRSAAHVPRRSPHSSAHRRPPRPPPAAPAGRTGSTARNRSRYERSSDYVRAVRV